MTDIEKEMQGTAQDICAFMKDKTCNDCTHICESGDCFFYNIVEKMYKLGYRKAENVRKETVIELLDYVGNFLILDTNGARKPLKELPAYLNVYSKYGIESPKSALPNITEENKDEQKET